MDLRNTQHIYRCIPPLFGNRAPEVTKGDDGKEVSDDFQTFYINLRGVSMAERDKAKAFEFETYQAYARDKAQEIVTQATYDLVKSRVQSIEGLSLDGKPCTDFDTLYNDGPPELLQWVFAAVFSTVLLSDAEVKN